MMINEILYIFKCSLYRFPFELSIKNLDKITVNLNKRLYIHWGGPKNQDVLNSYLPGIYSKICVEKTVLSHFLTKRSIGNQYKKTDSL